MSQVTQKGAVKPQMNITPLIDVVFLLIIFFMLVSNIVAEEAVPMIVPEVDEPKTIQLGEVDRVVINVAPPDFDKESRTEGNVLAAPGEAQYLKIGTRRYAMTAEGLKEAQEVLAARVANGPKDAEGNSTLEVVLRADAALFYSEVQPVMTMITAANISKVNLVAFMPED